VGGWIGGNGADVPGVRIVVMSYDPDGPTGTLVYDRTAHLLISEPDGKKFERRKAGPLSVQLRRPLGLEQKQARHKARR